MSPLRPPAPVPLDTALELPDTADTEALGERLAAELRRGRPRGALRAAGRRQDRAGARPGPGPRRRRARHLAHVRDRPRAPAAARRRRRAAGARRRLPARHAPATSPPSSTTSTSTPTSTAPWSPSSGARAWPSGCPRATCSSAWTAAPTTSGSPACTGSRRPRPSPGPTGPASIGPARAPPRSVVRVGSPPSYGNPLSRRPSMSRRSLAQIAQHRPSELARARMPRPVADQRSAARPSGLCPRYSHCMAQTVEQLDGLPVGQVALALDRARRVVRPQPARAASRPP